MAPVMAATPRRIAVRSTTLSTLMRPVWRAVALGPW
jgi:hypothetical protein